MERGLEQWEPVGVGLCPFAAFAGETNRGDDWLIKLPERVAANEVEAEFDDVAVSGWKLGERTGLGDCADHFRRGAEHHIAEFCLGADHGGIPTVASVLVNDKVPASSTAKAESARRCTSCFRSKREWIRMCLTQRCKGAAKARELEQAEGAWPADVEDVNDVDARDDSVRNSMIYRIAIYQSRASNAIRRNGGDLMLAAVGVKSEAVPRHLTPFYDCVADEGHIA